MRSLVEGVRLDKRKVGQVVLDGWCQGSDALGVGQLLRHILVDAVFTEGPHLYVRLQLALLQLIEINGGQKLVIFH